MENRKYETLEDLLQEYCIGTMEDHEFGDHLLELEFYKKPVEYWKKKYENEKQRNENCNNLIDKLNDRIEKLEKQNEIYQMDYFACLKEIEKLKACGKIETQTNADLSLESYGLRKKMEKMVEMLRWFRNREVEVHGESPNVDFIIKTDKLLNK